MTWLAGIVVMASGFWLIGLAASIVVMPARAARFLTGFASSARAHYTEQVFRLIAGAAIVIFAAEMRFPDLFRVFGWLVVLTTSGLLLIPWQWHDRFGEWAIPLAIRHIKLYALAAFVLGAFILYAAL
jgi:hypothetical protein